MANVISGQIIAIGQKQTIPSKNGGNTLIKREFVIRALRFNPDDGTPELSEFNTPSLEINGEDKIGVLDGFKVGDVVKVTFNVEGRSYEDQNHNMKYFNSIRANRIEKLPITLSQQAPTDSAPAPTAPAPTAPAAAPQGNAPQQEAQNILPF